MDGLAGPMCPTAFPHADAPHGQKPLVIPANAGIQGHGARESGMDSRFRGNDGGKPCGNHRRTAAATDFLVPPVANRSSLPVVPRHLA